MITSCIHIRILERETRPFLLYGAVFGISVFGLLSIFWHYEPHITEQTPERRIILDLVYLPPPESPLEETPTPVPVKPQPETETEPEVPVHITSTVDTASHDSVRVTILGQPHVSEPDFPLSADSSKTGLDVHIDKKTYRFDPLAEYAPEEPEEDNEVRDERREFKHDILGIRLDGPPDLIINGGRHALKSLKWMVDDMRRDRWIKYFRENMMAEVSAKDVRFLTLLWAHEYLDPITMTVEEREFVAESSGNQIMNNTQYIDDMESRGMVRSLKVNGRIVYEPTVTKDAFIGACFAYASAHPDDPAPEIYLELITGEKPHMNTSQSSANETDTREKQIEEE